MENLINCQICLEKFENPKILSCYHTFCLKCIKQCHENQKTDKSRITCPNCRKETNVENRQVENLTNDFKISSLLDSICVYCERNFRENGKKYCSKNCSDIMKHLENLIRHKSKSYIIKYHFSFLDLRRICMGLN